MFKKIEALTDYRFEFDDFARSLIQQYVTQENYDDNGTHYEIVKKGREITSYTAFKLTDRSENVSLTLYSDGINYFILKLSISDEENDQHTFIYKFPNDDKFLNKHIPQDLMIDLGSESEVSYEDEEMDED